MRIFPKFRFEEDQSLNPQILLAGLLLAVKGQTTSDVELMHISSNLAGPSNDSFMVRAADLRDLIHTAERQLSNVGLETFIERGSALLNDKQKLASLVTIMDVCMVENSLLEGERAVFDQIRDGFGISDDELRPFEEMLILKNDSSIRLNVLPNGYNRAAEGFQALV